MVTVVYQCHRLRSSELQCYVDGVLALNTEVTLPQQEEVRGRGGEEERERGGEGRGRKRERMFVCEREPSSKVREEDYVYLFTYCFKF